MGSRCSPPQPQQRPLWTVRVLSRPFLALPHQYATTQILITTRIILTHRLRSLINMHHTALFPAQLLLPRMNLRTLCPVPPSMPRLKLCRGLPTLLQRQPRPLRQLSHQGEWSRLWGVYLTYWTLSRVKKRKRAAEPTPRNAFPHVVEKAGFFLRI
jgi:hypothetical protein